ncbi:hypothetical protein LO80_03265 [Candidatus Francisella endociliophora]|uniref:Uncharacterized protein n=1 Tax=Candidatus Francisella endociliophora TaxID=653937 RepID=A0A097ENE3_9GAMM|nr:hypothetical protein [Francisella sp. FSC1006]AIT09087.1 hypothetical protein LO80_03265 [Francisella sp. FSC1006]
MAYQTSANLVSLSENLPDDQRYLLNMSEKSANNMLGEIPVVTVPNMEMKVGYNDAVQTVKKTELNQSIRQVELTNGNEKTEVVKTLAAKIPAAYMQKYYNNGMTDEIIANQMRKIATDTRNDFYRQIFKGYSNSMTTDVIDGLQVRCNDDGVNHFYNGIDTANKAPKALSLSFLDEMIMEYLRFSRSNPVIILPSRMYSVIFAKAMRDGKFGNFIMQKNEFGKTIMTYNDIPVRSAGTGVNGETSQYGQYVLDFDEVALDASGSTTGSIYLADMNSTDGMFLINSSSAPLFEIRKNNDLNGNGQYDTFMFMAMGFGTASPIACTRISNISNSDIVD